MDSDQIRDIVRDLICAQYLPGESPENLTDGTKLVSEGIFDSLASLKLVACLEEQFGIRIDAHEVDVDHLDTLSAIVSTVNAKRI